MGGILPVPYRAAGDIAAACCRAAVSPACLRALGRGSRLPLGREPVLPAFLRQGVLSASQAGGFLIPDQLAQADRRGGCRVVAHQDHRGGNGGWFDRQAQYRAGDRRYNRHGEEHRPSHRCPALRTGPRAAGEAGTGGRAGSPPKLCAPRAAAGCPGRPLCPCAKACAA